MSGFCNSTLHIDIAMTSLTEKPFLSVKRQPHHKRTHQTSNNRLTHRPALSLPLLSHLQRRPTEPKYRWSGRPVRSRPERVVCSARYAIWPKQRWCSCRAAISWPAVSAPNDSTTVPFVANQSKDMSAHSSRDS